MSIFSTYQNYTSIFMSAAPHPDPQILLETLTGNYAQSYSRVRTEATVSLFNNPKVAKNT